MFLLNLKRYTFYLLIILFVLFSETQGICSHQFYRIGGTGSALATMRLLAADFQTQHPEIHIQVLPSLGTSGGLRALKDGALDLCLAARPLSPEEKQQNLEYRPYAQTVITFVGNSKSASESLTAEEIAAILSGAMTRWPNGDYIRLVMRSLRESDFIPLIEYSRDMSAAMHTASQRTDIVFGVTAQDNIRILQDLPGSFGITSLAQICSEKAQLTPLRFNDIAPTLENLKNGSYPFSKTFALVYYKDVIPDGLQSFVDFVFSETARQILSASGHSSRGD